MHDTTNIIEALALGMLVGAVAGAVAVSVLSSTAAARRRARDHERLERMKRYLADAQGARRANVLPTGARALVEPAPSPLDILVAASRSADPPCSAAGGSFGVKPAPILELVVDEPATGGDSR